MAVDKFLAAAQQLYDCFCAQLQLLPVADQPNRCCLLATPQFELGAAVNEDMCRCGTAWTRIGGFTPSSVFPAPQDQASNCGPEQWALTLELGVARCPPTGTAADLPTCAEYAAYTTKVMADAQAMRQAVICCYGPSSVNRLYLINGWEPFGPEGLCGGGRLTLQVPILRCNEC